MLGKARLAIVATMACLIGAAGFAGDLRGEREARTTSELARLLSPLGVVPARSLLEVRSWRRIQLDWSRPGADVPAAFGERASERRLTILAERPVVAGPARLRALELSESQILVVATDRRRQLKWWTAMPDPRTVRAETGDEQGALVDGGGISLGRVAFGLEVPDDPEIRDLHVYHPRWNGAAFELESLAAVTRVRK